MKAPSLPDDLEIAPGYTVGCWKKLSLNAGNPSSPDWDKALKIFDARIRSRFLDPVDTLIESEKCCSRKRFGFAVLAIDFLIIETLQGFRDGEVNHNGKSKKLFASFLVNWDAFTSCVPKGGDAKKRAEQVYRDYRCALHHSGSTTDAFRVGVSGPVFDFRSGHEVKINRTCLHKELKRKFNTYLADLHVPASSELRRKFLRKMNAICGVP